MSDPKSHRTITYQCSECGGLKSRENLKAKRVQFKEMGLNGSVIKTRTVAWLCLECMEMDPDYNRPHLAASPGMADTRIAR